MKISKLLLIVSILFISLIGCAANSKLNTSEEMHHQSLEEKKIMAFNKISKSEESFIVPVPAPNNVISRKIMLATLKAGVSSNAIDSLVKLLELDKAIPIVVISDKRGSDDITAATIESAFQRIQKIKPKATLYFVGEEKYGIPLQSKAQAVQINYKFIPYPAE